MDALHASAPSHRPAPPAGLRQALTTFSPALEGARQEWFLAGTENASISLASAHGGTARISSPGNGMVIAIDPDIPDSRQRVTIAAEGDTSSLVLRLDDRDLGPAAERHLWKPEHGAHRLVLADRSGQERDRILFTVR
jgi:penicillin-binding protein 1C